MANAEGLTRQERLKLPPVPMREQRPEVRRGNFLEVPLGYSPDEAQREATRCLQCSKPPCVPGCPVSVDIPGFMRHMAAGRFDEALRVVRKTNSLPAVCGRVCPQEDQCQARCTLGKIQGCKPVSIGRLERFVGDRAIGHGQEGHPPVSRHHESKVAIAGSGPAGLTAAGELALLGHQVTVFEAFGEAGGVLLYGIPEFRLPKQIVHAEVNYLSSLGVQFELNCLVGKTVRLGELMNTEGYRAAFIGTGAGLPHFMELAGEDLIGVYSANEFLTRSNMMRAYRFPEHDTPLLKGKRAAVIGGGNVAMDSARTALRLGYEEVTVVYRRTEEEMPARDEEIEHGKEEGIRFEMLTVPVRYVGDSDGRLSGLECLRTALGPPDESGRRSPIPIKGSEFIVEADIAVVAVGSGANPILVKATPGLCTDKRGHITVDPVTGATSLRGVYAGGDIVTGAATVIEAMGAGRRSAAAIDAFLREVKGDGVA